LQLVSPTAPARLLSDLRETGLERLQIALDPLRENPAAWGDLPRLCQAEGVSFASGMFGTIGEDYTTLETIRRTGGVVPDATWPENWRNIQVVAELAQNLKLSLVTFHAGFLPHDEDAPEFQKLLGRIKQIGRLFADRGIDLGFETGQEEAGALRSFLEQLNQSNVGVNFDPANMILYDKGDPIDALRTLGPWLRQCHIKDAKRTRTPGQWGEEVVVGTGEVDWKRFFQTLRELGFQGNCCIEREAGAARVADIRTAREFLDKVEL
jgi:L-ribulose-5-phosphate 3-epimerase